jgi:hypothetical protein
MVPQLIYDPLPSAFVLIFVAVVFSLPIQQTQNVMNFRQCQQDNFVLFGQPSALPATGGVDQIKPRIERGRIRIALVAQRWIYRPIFAQLARALDLGAKIGNLGV